MLNLIYKLATEYGEVREKRRTWRVYAGVIIMTIIVVRIKTG